MFFSMSGVCVCVCAPGVHYCTVIEGDVKTHSLLITCFKLLEINPTAKPVIGLKTDKYFVSNQRIPY